MRAKKENQSRASLMVPALFFGILIPSIVPHLYPKEIQVVLEIEPLGTRRI